MANAQKDVEFLDPGDLHDGELHLTLANKQAADLRRGWVAAYSFTMRHADTREAMGNIQLRLSESYFIRMYAGHIGYRVEPPYRGKRLASRSCRLLLPLAQRHALQPLWITCNPDNLASRRSCELAGGELVEIVDVPQYTQLYQRGDRQKCRYRFDLTSD